MIFLLLLSVHIIDDFVHVHIMLFDFSSNDNVPQHIILYSEISILLILDFIDNLGFLECSLKPKVNK